MQKELNVFVLLTMTLTRHWRALSVIFVLSASIAIVYMFSLPRYYTSTVQVVPETKQNNSLASLSGGLADMASIAGISLNSMSGDDAINPDIYPDIFKSNDFIVDVLGIEVETLDGKRMNYYEYVMNHSPMAWWEQLLDNERPIKLPKIDPKRLTRKQELLLREIQESIQCFIDKKTGMIDLRVTAFDASVAATLADGIMTKLQGYITDYRTSKIRNDIAYSEQLAKTAKADYEKAQRNYVSYSDSHQDVLLSEYQTRRTELENEMQLQYQQYNQVQQQLILLQGKLQERVPAFTVIQSASIPTRPAGPKRVFGVLGIVAFTLFVAFAGFTIQGLRQWRKNTQVVTDAE